MNVLKKHFFRAIGLGVLIYIGFLVYYYLDGRIDSGFGLAEAWENFYENMLFAVILYLANVFWLDYYGRKYKEILFTLRGFIIGIAGNVMVTLAGIFVARVILIVGIYQWPIGKFMAEQALNEYQMPFFISMVISVIFYGGWYYKHRQENKVKEQKIIAGTASAKFDALKNQLDPHFLFNSLNVLTSLIDENPDQAQKFTTSLSKVYRYVLEQKNKDLITVDEELQFARTYVRLLKMRFEDSIIVDIPEHCSDPEAKIIPLSLQLLLENAVKHNVVSESRPLHLTVHEEEGMLFVSNNLQEKQVVKKSSGVGLQNIRQRYGILTDKQVNITKTETHFTVQLPMLTKTISKMETQEIYLKGKRYEKAKERVEHIKGFYGNLLAYCIVIPFLAILNYQTTDFPWVLFPIFGWGWGVISHGMGAFGYNPLWGKGWEEKKMRKYMEDENF